MILRQSDAMLIMGITGKQGTFWTERMQEYGSRIMGGVNPNKAGTEHCGVPVYASAVDAMNDTSDGRGGFDVAVLFIPPMGIKAAALDAIEAGAKKMVILTEHIPVQDVMYVCAAADEAGARIIGPNTTGVATPGECFAGFMPMFNDAIMRPGDVGVISRSGSLGTLICLNLVRAGYGQSAFLGIGGDPVIGTTTRQALEDLDADPGTKAIAMVGEIGGTMEEEAAEYAKGMSKPIVAFIAGGASPEGKKMGHAGAIVMGGKGTHESKTTALRAAGVTVIATPSDVGEAMKAARKS
jgi:succinyl-CoA synthetase alpha subunit